MTQKFWPKIFVYPSFCIDPKHSLTQIFWHLIFCWPKFLQWPKNFDPKCSLTQIFWPLVFCWPKFLQWSKNFDPKCFFDPNFWPKITGDPKFYHDPKILTQKFWVINFWPVFFGLAGLKNFNTVRVSVKLLYSVICNSFCYYIVNIYFFYKFIQSACHAS